jgi:hypothetical protein
MNRPSVNHIITQAIPALFSPALSSPCGGNSDQEALTYAWGADGKLANFATTIYNPTGSPSQTTTTMSAHWDGDDLLYVVEAGGSNPELYVEKLGYMYLNGTTWTTTIYDRDQSGTAVDRHGGTNSGSSYAWFAQLSLDNVHPYGTAHAKCMGTLGNFSCNGVVTNPPAATAGGSSCGTLCGTLTMSAILDAGREDGYYDGTVSIQGVRAFDPSMNQWTTPDAYSGDVHDPMSQHPYMWNNNNPVQYGDPSGYDAIVQAIAQGGVDLLELGSSILGGVAGGVLTAGIAVLTPGKLADDTESGYNRDHPGASFDHSKNARPSTGDKHQAGQRRAGMEGGGEKGDKNRKPPRKRPDGWKGPWPAKSDNDGGNNSGEANSGAQGGNGDGNGQANGGSNNAGDNKGSTN